MRKEAVSLHWNYLKRLNMHLKNIPGKKLLVAALLSFAGVLSHQGLIAQTVTDVANDTIRLCEGTTVVIDLLANDVDVDPGESLETDILVGPSSVLIDYDDDALPEGSYAIEVDASFTGTDFMIYEVCGEDDLCATGILTIIVAGEEGCVWPGDANGDSICNYIDLLPIGVYYGFIGPDREDADGGWDEAFCDEWEEPIGVIYGNNPKFSDCNGDGLINAADTVVLVNNYGLLRGAYTPTGFIGGPEDPLISIDLLADTIAAGSKVVVPINFGTAGSPATNIYGTTFDIVYDKTLIKKDSIKVTFNSGWLGTPGEDIIYLQKNDTLNGILSVTVTRINHITRTGYDHFAELSFVMEDNIAGKTYDQITSTVNFCIELPQVINQKGVGIPVQTGCDSVVALQFTGLQNNNWNTQIITYPNPAHEFVNVVLPENTTGQYLIINQLGEVIVQQQFTTNQFNISTQHIPSGNYILQIIADAGLIHKQLIVQH